MSKVPDLVFELRNERTKKEQFLRERNELNEQLKKLKSALRKIVCLNIPMPDEVFNIANDALEGRE